METRTTRQGRTLGSAEPESAGQDARQVDNLSIEQPCTKTILSQSTEKMQPKLTKDCCCGRLQLDSLRVALIPSPLHSSTISLQEHRSQTDAAVATACEYLSTSRGVSKLIVSVANERSSKTPELVDSFSSSSSSNDDSESSLGTLISNEEEILGNDALPMDDKDWVEVSLRALLKAALSPRENNDQLLPKLVLKGVSNSVLHNLLTLSCDAFDPHFFLRLQELTFETTFDDRVIQDVTNLLAESHSSEEIIVNLRDLRLCHSSDQRLRTYPQPDISVNATPILQQGLQEGGRSLRTVHLTGFALDDNDSAHRIIPTKNTSLQQLFLHQCRIRTAVLDDMSQILQGLHRLSLFQSEVLPDSVTTAPTNGRNTHHQELVWRMLEHASSLSFRRLSNGNAQESNGDGYDSSDDECENDRRLSSLDLFRCRRKETALSLLCIVKANPRLTRLDHVGLPRSLRSVQDSLEFQLKIHQASCALMVDVNNEEDWCNVLADYADTRQSRFNVSVLFHCVRYFLVGKIL